MPRHSSQGWIPTYRHHRSSGHAYVCLSGKNHFLGKFGTPESREKYDRLIAEWLTRNRRAQPCRADGAGDMTVTELLAAYRLHVEAAYTSPAVAVIKAASRHLRALYGHLPVREFTPMCLKAVQRAMCEARDEGSKRSRLCRGTVNDYAARIRQAFKWGVSEGLVPPAVWHGLQAVAGLRRGRSGARETEPVGPVPDAHVEATLPHLSPVLADMVRVQRLSGMRPGELCRLRRADLDASGEVWLYKPGHHKTRHLGKDRVVPLGPKAQEVITPYLRPELDAPLFRPADSLRLLWESQRQHRATPMTPSQIARSKRAARRTDGPAARRGYSVPAYRRAIARAAKKAGVPAWPPNELRHARATELRREFGIDVAGAVLGHSQLSSTQVYAERNLEAASKAALATG